jgi:CubicO group peptidase (beta-lactamase class C family)
MIARARGLIKDLDAPLSSFGWEGPRDTVSLTLRQLLSHRSGLPAWRPLYLIPEGRPKLRPARAREAALRERPLFPPGQGTLYSDLGFMLLGFFLEEIFGARLPEIFRREIAEPLGLASARFSPRQAPEGRRGRPGPVAPTEDGLRCGGPLDWPGVPILGPVPPGRVHDDNAAWLGGAAGHAGLFAQAADVALIVSSWLAALGGKGGIVPGGALREFCSLQGPAGESGRRALGFDAAARPGGRRLLFGHKGYTGAMAWFDPERGDAAILLCNRVHPSSRRGGMEALRARLAELAFPA